MRQKITLIIALACILVYGFAIGFGAFQIYNNMQEQKVLAERDFSNLKDQAVSSALVLGFMTDPYKEEMKIALGKSKTGQALIISSMNSSFAEYRRPGIVTVEGDNFRLQEKFGMVRKNSAIDVAGVTNAHISVASDIVSHTFFITILKNTLLTVLVSLAAAFLTLIIETLITKSPEAVPAAKIPKDDVPDIQDEPRGFSEETGDFDIPSMDDSANDNSSGVFDENPRETAVENKNCSGPQGLYSPHGNISWEAYTKDRLASELHRCASFEQDMVFIIMEFRGNKQKDETFFNAFTEMAVGFFGHRDLIFEWKTDGISIVVPNIDLDQGFAKCEDFYNRVKSKLLSSSSLEFELCIGLSSRAGRLIDAERLIFETAQAVSRALVDPVSPIIAFKSDPEKYRAFIASQGKENDPQE